MQILIWCTSDDVTCKLNLLKKSVQTTVMITLYTPTLDKLVEETVQIFSLFDLTRQILLVALMIALCPCVVHVIRLLPLADAGKSFYFYLTFMLQDL